MKRIRCPKCSNYIIFDETKYVSAQRLNFICPQCGKKFSIRKKNNSETKESLGIITVIENSYHYRQDFNLHSGDNTIGRHRRDNNADCAIQTDDLRIDYLNSIINVSKDKNGNIKYVLRDGPSYHGTFVGNERLSPKEKRILHDGDIFVIGESTVILKANSDKNE